MMSNEPPSQPAQDPFGKLALLSSGETSPSGRRVHQRMLSDLKAPVRVAILETPAGFEVNSSLVAQRVGDFLTARLRNFAISASVIPARRRDGPFSTNDEQLLTPMLDAAYLYLGAGSPTYLVNHLKGSLALSYLVGRLRRGASLCLASAAAIAFGSKALPVYEIFKAGHDLHWVDGLDLFGLFGLDLAIVSHWDNSEGGARLDTSRCFMGEARMERLRTMLPPATRVLGIDEHTGLIFDFQAEECQVMGRGGVTVISPEATTTYPSGSTFPVERLGPYHPPAEGPTYGFPVGGLGNEKGTPVAPSAEVLELIQRREEARQARNWTRADALRQQVAAAGFEIQDTPEGPQWRYLGTK